MEFTAALVYSRIVASEPLRSPTSGLILGLVIIIVAVVAYSAYITRQISGLRALQTNVAERNRRDALQLLRIQNDLNLLSLTMRDILDDSQNYPVTAWPAQFQRIRIDLEDALQKEEALAVEPRNPGQRQYLAAELGQFWRGVERMFALAAVAQTDEARAEIRESLLTEVAALSTDVDRLLVENNENEKAAAEQASEIYDRVERQVYLFLTATLAAILLTSLYVIASNRRLFAELAALSEQRSELAQKLISTQESTLRHISRELHDEFGQILTAVGAMLGRAERHAPADSPLRTELREVSEIAQETLEKVRMLSQALHPVMLEEAGLEATVSWYVANVEKQTGLTIAYEQIGNPFAVDGGAAIHIYRVLQEAVNNAARHSGAKEAWVRLRFGGDGLELEVEDHGKGFSGQTVNRGIGLVAMRERAELLGGTIEFSTPAGGGTLVRLRVPREKAEAHG
jgi:signal transduction histidine kinase